ncbi:putative metal-binding motif-containing protein [Pyxidicoccus fallax]|uniref:putative metal-binding motif-containing protein n=1 Tax=Pyxidicoccus fallax TaxID=394095 RepID=UPI0031B571A7
MAITYATFHPGCLTLSVVDREDPSRTDVAQVPVEAGGSSGTELVAILGREGWSRNLTLTASARERSCNGPVVAEQSVEAQVPVEGITETRLALRAEDLDGDGYVSARGERPGSDCDDDDANIHPAATELCDGIDNNCANGEADAPDALTYYADADGDGYAASNAQPRPACVPPSGFVTQLGDCNDADARIHPGQQESVCDGVDEDCDGVPDDDGFAVGTSCTTAQGCAGMRSCQSTSSAACVSQQQPSDWYVDEDGDGRAGAAVGPGCVAPVPGATTERTDCDESTRFASTGARDVCDRLDNDCDGQVDEDDPGCAAVTWRQDTVGVATGNWNAVAPYGQDRGWLAGDAGRVVHVSGTAFDAVTSCAGEWRSAWAASNGRVFLGASTGELATVRPDALASCERVGGPGSAPLNGMVGFEQGTTVRLFAVDSQGRVIRWEYVEGAPTQAAPQLVTQVASNLRAIHGLGPETLLAVGAETVGLTERPVAWRAPASGSTWTKENLGVPTSTGYLRAVRVLTPRLAYVAGDDGLLLERSGTTWTARSGPTPSGSGTPDYRALLAFGRTALYVVTSTSNDLHFFDGTAWNSVIVAAETLNALEGTGPGDVWGAGHDGALVRWRP